MMSADLFPGRQYGIRFRPDPRVAVREPLTHVQLVAKVGRGGKVLVRHLYGEHKGLEEYVPARQIICPWGERRAFLRDENRMDALRRTTKRLRDLVVEKAINVVMHTTGESSLHLNNQGVFGGDSVALDRVATRAGLRVNELDGMSHTDRHGQTWMTSRGGLRLAQGFAAAEPDVVQLFIESEEAELKARGYADRFHHDCLSQQRPAFALARQWAGHEAEVEQLRTEVQRLGTLIEGAAIDLAKAGATRQANALRRRLKSGR